MLGVEMLYKELFFFSLSLSHLDHFGHVYPQPEESTLGLQPQVGVQQKATAAHVSAALYMSDKKNTQIHIFAEKSLGLWVRKLYFLQLIRHSQQVSGQKLTSGPFYRL